MKHVPSTQYSAEFKVRSQHHTNFMLAFFKATALGKFIHPLASRETVTSVPIIVSGQRVHFIDRLAFVSTKHVRQSVTLANYTIVPSPKCI